MVRYRLCFINPKTNQIDRERDIEAADDVDAAHVASESDHRPLELWCGDRKVRTFSADNLAAAGG
ncbi:MAG TPA: hypothetical protein VHN55_09720 [Sphingomicrobium sp.]|nr:hypothetical protein [Sphingomicrobium sp.]